MIVPSPPVSSTCGVCHSALRPLGEAESAERRRAHECSYSTCPLWSRTMHLDAWVGATWSSWRLDLPLFSGGGLRTCPGGRDAKRGRFKIGGFAGCLTSHESFESDVAHHEGTLGLTGGRQRLPPGNYFWTAQSETPPGLPHLPLRPDAAKTWPCGAHAIARTGPVETVTRPSSSSTQGLALAKSADATARRSIKKVNARGHWYGPHQTDCGP